MSRRRLEQGANAASSFCLRTSVGANTNSSPVATASISKPAFRLLPNTATLTIKSDGGGGPKPAAAVVSTMPAAKVRSTWHNKTTPIRPEHNPDVMRLTAVVEGMTERNTSLTEKVASLETQLQRAGQIIVQERAATAQHVASMENRLSTMQQSEDKLRAELSSRPVAKEIDASKFMNSVNSALEAEDAMIRVDKAEARVQVLNAQADALQEQLKTMRVEADSVLRCASPRSSPSTMRSRPKLCACGRNRSGLSVRSAQRPPSLTI